MKSDRRRRLIVPALAVLVLLTAVTASAQDIPLKNWTPAPWPGASERTALADVGIGPILFMPTTPCRQYDSRNTSPLADNTPRTVTLTGAPCSIPTGALAVSVNITVFSIIGAGSNGVFKADTVSPPVVAWINYPPTETQRGNAGSVPLTGAGAIIVQVNQGAGSVNFTVDTNGYYIGGTGTINPGEFVGIIGTENAGGLLYAKNLTAANFFTNSAVRGVISNVNPSQGLFGEQRAATGVNYGVKGTNSSTTDLSAGVIGTSGTVPTLTGYSTIGVLGQAGAAVGYGVVGAAQGIGAYGTLVDSTGAFLRGGRIGYSTYGVYAQGDFGGTGAKYFVEPHPVDAKKIIKYIAMEGPESATFFRGRSRFDGKVAVIPVPEDFRMVSDPEGLTVHVTPIGGQASAWVTRMDLDTIVVESTRDVEFSYIVYGVRKAFKGFQPIQDGDEFAPEGPNDKLPRYLTEEAKQRLISNGTYNADGTVNMQTAERLGWAQKWRDRERAQQEAAARAGQEPTPLNGQSPRN